MRLIRMICVGYVLTGGAAAFATTYQGKRSGNAVIDWDRPWIVGGRCRSGFSRAAV